MKSQFALFQSHLDLAHCYWERLVQKSDLVIDATCGNGHDTLFLAKLGCCRIIGLDIQKSAIEKTVALLHQELNSREIKCVQLFHQSHTEFPTTILPTSTKLIIYNLGYLPGGDKSKTTVTESTVQSLKNALPLIMPGGAISITCYPGHHEGMREKDALVAFVQSLDPKEWSCCHHEWLNRKQAPTLLWIQRALKAPNQISV